MGQLNMHLTPEFASALAELMRRRRIGSKAEAIRTAVFEAVRQLRGGQEAVDFRTWIGIGLAAPLNPDPQFKSEDELWG